MDSQSPIADLVRRYPIIGSITGEITAARDLIVDAYRRKRMLFICGNGGSAADAQHIVGELMKSFCLPRPLSKSLQEALRAGPDRSLGDVMADSLETGLPALALGESFAFGTAVANDIDSDLVFAQQLLALAQSGDVLLGISTSGNSTNVRAALQVARAIGVGTIGLTGGTGGAFSTLCDVAIIVPETETYLVQEFHLPIYHALCREIEESFFPTVIDGDG